MSHTCFLSPRKVHIRVRVLRAMTVPYTRNARNERDRTDPLLDLGRDQSAIGYLVTIFLTVLKTIETEKVD